MYFNVNTTAFQDIPSVPALLSLAEMLYSRSPDVSSVFVNYASKLVQNHLAKNGSRPDRAAAFAVLQSQAQQLRLPSPKTVETFANSLMASANGPHANDFYQIAYLAYASLSIFGPLSNSIQTRLTNAQSKFNASGSQQQGGAPPFTSYGSGNTGAGGPPVFTPYGGNTAGGPPTFTPYGNSAGGPPVFNPSAQGGNQSTSAQGGPPVFTPYGGSPQGGPPVFTPQGSSPSLNQNTQGGPPVFTPQGSSPSFNQNTQGGPPVFTPQGGPPLFTPTSSGGSPAFTPQGGPPSFTPSSPGGPPVFTPQNAPPSYGEPPSFTPTVDYGQNKSTVSPKAKQLMELAQQAFKAGAADVAYSALQAAIKELEK